MKRRESMRKRKTAGKWVSSGICLVMIAVSSGCGGKKEQDPMELYKAALEKNAELENLDMSLETTMTMKMGESSAWVGIDMEVLMTGYPSKEMKYQADTTMEILGQSVSTTLYYVDGYYYMDLNGQKVKYPYDLDQMVELAEKNKDNAVAAEAIKELKVEKEGENTRLEFQAYPEKMTEYTKNIFGSMQEWVGDYEWTLQEVSGSYLINPDGYNIESTIDMTLQMESNGQKIDVDAQVKGEVHDPGKPVEVNLPEDLDSYMEIDENLMAQ